MKEKISYERHDYEAGADAPQYNTVKHHITLSYVAALYG